MARKFDNGEWVKKPAGYPFPGKVVAAFTTLGGAERYVVEYVDKDEGARGLLHIFAPEQLALMYEPEEY